MRRDIVARLQMPPVYYLHACDEEFMRRWGFRTFSPKRRVILVSGCPDFLPIPGPTRSDRCDNQRSIVRQPNTTLLRVRLRIPLILAAFGVSATPTRQLSCSLTSIINDLPTISCATARSSTTATPGGTDTVSETDTSCPKTDGRWCGG